MPCSQPHIILRGPHTSLAWWRVLLQEGPPIQMAAGMALPPCHQDPTCGRGPRVQGGVGAGLLRRSFSLEPGPASRPPGCAQH